MAEFNANELSEYIEERIKSNAISSAVDFVVECFKYKKLKNKKVEILYTYTDITTIIEDSEKELVALFTVLSEKRAEILHRRSLDRSVSVSLEHRADGVEYIVSSCHFCRSEVSGSLWNGWFLCHVMIILL